MIIDYIENDYVVSVVGMCKNAGKTTVLNKLIEQYRGERLALTSVGRDGESQDVVTNTIKPKIYVNKGVMFATASELLPFCHITKEIIYTTNINTPLGKVVIVRALSCGFVQLAGPSMVDQLQTLKDLFIGLGATKILIDGAISRRSIGNPDLSNSIILSTGASLSHSIDELVEQTAYMVKLLSVEKMDEKLYQTIKEHKGTLFLSSKNDLLAKDLSLKETPENTKFIYVDTALTDSLVAPLLSLNINDLTIYAYDSSKIMLSKKIYDNLVVRKIGLGVVKNANLRVVTINPLSYRGIMLDKNILLKRMQQEIQIPVVNVEEE
ncbi:MAG: hypothetical protein RR248_02235 [Clostridia bacterium]